MTYPANLFAGLNVNRKGRRTAPHKAVLLLSVIDLVEEGVIDTPFVELSDALKQRFTANWKRYVPLSSPFCCNIACPFQHLSSSPFWQLRKLPTYEPRKEYSMSALERSFAGADLSAEVFAAMQDSRQRDELRRLLIATYLSDPSAPTIDLTGLTPTLLLLLAGLFAA